MGLKVNFKEGDVLLLINGDILTVVEEFKGDLTRVQFIEQDESSFVDLGKLKIECNLGQSSKSLFHFNLMRQIHLRLNSLSKV